jgi:hypothetical protein
MMRRLACAYLVTFDDMEARLLTRTELKCALQGLACGDYNNIRIELGAWGDEEEEELV